eukprot:3124052-Pyramimonas_sp.AAC.1
MLEALQTEFEAQRSDYLLAHKSFVAARGQLEEANQEKSDLRKQLEKVRSRHPFHQYGICKCDVEWCTDQWVGCYFFILPLCMSAPFALDKAELTTGVNGHLRAINNPYTYRGARVRTLQENDPSGLVAWSVLLVMSRNSALEAELKASRGREATLRAELAQEYTIAKGEGEVGDNGTATRYALPEVPALLYPTAETSSRKQDTLCDGPMQPTTRTTDPLPRSRHHSCAAEMVLDEETLPIEPTSEVMSHNTYMRPCILIIKRNKYVNCPPCHQENFCRHKERFDVPHTSMQQYSLIL